MKFISILCLLIPSFASAINVTLNLFHDACGNGTGRIVAIVSGGVGAYTFDWSPTPPNGQGTNVITGLFAGTYTVTVTDSNGDEISASGTINTLPTLYPGNVNAGSATSCDMLCNGTYGYSTMITGWGGQSPYSVTVIGGGGGNVSNNGLGMYGLCPGNTYDATVTDALGCASVFSGIEVFNMDTPVLQNIEVTASCEFGSNGTATLTFDQTWVIVQLSWFWGGGNFYYSDQNGVVVIDNLSPALYEAMVYPHPPNGGAPGGGPCGAPVDFTIPISTDPCGSISGMVHVDLDADCIMNGDDVFFPECVLLLEPQGYIMTEYDGTYATEVFYGNHTIGTTVPGYLPVCPPVVPAPFTVNAGTPAVVIDIAMEPLTGPDIQAFCYGGTPRPGFPMSYSIFAKNFGPYPHAPFTATFTFDPLLIFVSSSVAPDVIAPGMLEFSFNGLSAWQHQGIQMQFNVPPDPQLIGTEIIATATIFPVSADVDPGNNSYSITRMIVGAYDPNDKLARTSSAASDEHYFIQQDEYIDYTIRFQNTGNAEAYHVHLIDTISTDLDLGSLQIIATSHDYQVQLLPGRVLRFDFPDIMLPDSASDELGSQGFASFRIKPHNDPMVGDVLENFADIYFDLNPPIRTNTSQLVVESSTSIEHVLADRRPIVWPNPSGDVVNIRMQDNVPIDGWRMYDAFGRPVGGMDRPLEADMLTIPLAGLASGSYCIEVLSKGIRSFVRVVKIE